MKYLLITIFSLVLAPLFSQAPPNYTKEIFHLSVHIERLDGTVYCLVHNTKNGYHSIPLDPVYAKSMVAGCDSITVITTP